MQRDEDQGCGLIQTQQFLERRGFRGKLASGGKRDDLTFRQLRIQPGGVPKYALGLPG